MRASWSGFLRLSLVSVPVQAFTAEQPYDGGVRFNQLHAECHRRVQYKKFCPVHGELTKDEIVSGYQYAANKYVVLDEEEIERAADDRAIAISQFIPPSAVDPSYYSGRTYFLAPDGDAGREPYVLLCHAMHDEERWALAQATMWGRNRLLLIRPEGHLLVMEMMQFADEVRSPDELGDLVPKSKPKATELKLARRLIADASEDSVRWSQQFDERKEDIRKLIEAKVRGRDDVVEDRSEKAGPPTLELIDALRRSVKRPKAKKARTSKASAKPKLRVVGPRTRRKTG
jgi:DNA end-binding protein Ku